MKIKSIVLIMLFLVFTLCSCIVLFSGNNEKKKEDSNYSYNLPEDLLDETDTELNNETSEVIQKKNYDNILEGFTKTMYNYNTEERLYYEGCDKYMTENAYQNFVPLEDVEVEESEYDDNEDISEIRSVESKLLSMEHYDKVISENEIHSFVEVNYTTSIVSENETYQLLKIILSNSGEWKINHIEIITTIEN